ncbi:hypothetical protein H8356DRAFT_1695111 [Neocallimastix lanati (nom. inval.)]|nr:hypothetical protein H8356DRAFT_1695111 [Neocallimastix sp. JGI-2020a]
MLILQNKFQNLYKNCENLNNWLYYYVFIINYKIYNNFIYIYIIKNIKYFFLYLNNIFFLCFNNIFL